MSHPILPRLKCTAVLFPKGRDQRQIDGWRIAAFTFPLRSTPVCSLSAPSRGTTVLVAPVYFIAVLLYLFRLSGPPFPLPHLSPYPLMTCQATTRKDYVVKWSDSPDAVPRIPENSPSKVHHTTRTTLSIVKQINRLSCSAVPILKRIFL